MNDQLPTPFAWHYGDVVVSLRAGGGVSGARVLGRATSAVGSIQRTIHGAAGRARPRGAEGHERQGAWRKGGAGPGGERGCAQRGDPRRDFRAEANVRGERRAHVVATPAPAEADAGDAAEPRGARPSSGSEPGTVQQTRVAATAVKPETWIGKETDIKVDCDGDVKADNGESDSRIGGAMQ